MAEAAASLAAAAAHDTKALFTPRAAGGVPPLWFEPSRFSTPAFDPERYIADVRRFVPLELLAGELGAHLGQLRARLVDVINADYADFISLSTHLVNVDGAVQRMQAPLLGLQAQLGTVRGSVAAELAALEDGLARRQAMAQARGTLELLRDVSQVTTKVEKLLGEYEAGAGAGAELEARARQWERLAGELAHARFFAARGEDLPLLRALAGALAAAQQRLERHLAAGLEEALRGLGPQGAGDAPLQGAAAQRVALLALQALHAIGAHDAAAQVYREVAVAPLVRGLLADLQRQGPRGEVTGTSAPDLFPQALKQVAEAMREQLGPLLEVVYAPASALQGLPLLSAAVLAQVDTALAAAAPGAYSPGLPDSFRCNYRAALAFLEALEGFCGGGAALRALRGAPQAAAFLQRFNLQIYASVRAQEVTGTLRDALAPPTLTALHPAAGHAAPGVALQLCQSDALRQCLERTCAEEVWLRPLADRLLRLALQLVNSFAAWLQAGLARLPQQQAPAGAAAAAGPAGAGHAPQGGEGAGAEEGAPGGEQWAARASGEQLCQLAGDVWALEAWLGSAFRARLAERLEGLPAQARNTEAEAVGAAVSAAAADLGAGASGVVRAAAEGAAGACGRQLAALRGVTASYRVTTRKAPQQHSLYASQVLGPLEALLASPAGRRLPGPGRRELAAAAVAAVSGRFAGQVSELLSTLRATDVSLQRMKETRSRRGGEAAGPEPGGMEFTDKIALQFFLDVKEFGRCAARAGATPEELPAFRALWRTVAPAAQADAISLA